MRAILAILMIVLLTVPGAAQFKPLTGDQKSKNADTSKKKNDDSGYKSALERLPDQKFDPWRNMR